MSERRLTRERRAGKEEEPDLEGDDPENGDDDEDALDGIAFPVRRAQRLVAETAIPGHAPLSGALLRLAHPAPPQTRSDKQNEPVADQDSGRDQDRQGRREVPPGPCDLRCDPDPGQRNPKPDHDRHRQAREGTGPSGEAPRGPAGFVASAVHLAYNIASAYSYVFELRRSRWMLITPCTLVSTDQRRPTCSKNGSAAGRPGSAIQAS